MVRFCSALYCLYAKTQFYCFLAQRGVVVTLCPEAAGSNHKEGSGKWSSCLGTGSLLCVAVFFLSSSLDNMLICLWFFCYSSFFIAVLGFFYSGKVALEKLSEIILEENIMTRMQIPDAVLFQEHTTVYSRKNLR